MTIVRLNSVGKLLSLDDLLNGFKAGMGQQPSGQSANPSIANPVTSANAQTNVAAIQSMLKGPAASTESQKKKTESVPSPAVVISWEAFVKAAIANPADSLKTE